MTTTDPTSTWLSRDQLAERLDIPPRTVDYWRRQGRGPKYARFGHHVRYRLDVVQAWETDQMRGGVAS